MCGVIGFAGPSSVKAALLFQSLLIADEVRGKHSTGFVILNGPKPVLIKKATSGGKFVQKGYTKLLFHRRFRMALGHNRLATSGGINDRNAHPFQLKSPSGPCFGIHNGVIHHTEKLAEAFQVQKASVDSETALRAIAHHAGSSESDLIKSIEAVTAQINNEGNFAFLYLDPQSKAIYFWRSPDRPLTIFDARKVGLGRWLTSTPEIFVSAWRPLMGLLPSIDRVSYFEARPYTVYRVADDERFEVEPIHRMKVNIQRNAYPLFNEEGGDRWY